jgi:hypothetical protein
MGIPQNMALLVYYHMDIVTTVWSDYFYITFFTRYNRLESEEWNKNDGRKVTTQSTWPFDSGEQKTECQFDLFLSSFYHGRYGIAVACLLPYGYRYDSLVWLFLYYVFHTVQPTWIILVISCMIRSKLHVYNDGRTPPR